MSQKRFTNAKIVILGGPRVGKTAFAVRFITRRYIGDYDANKEMLYTHKVAAPRDELTLEILDTASQMDEETLEKHIKWGEGFVLLYSVTDRASFFEANKLKDKLYQYRCSETPVVLVANKSDLLTARSVTEDEGLGLAGEMDCPKFELSVAEGFQDVNETMNELLCQVKREFVKNLHHAVVGLEKRSRLYNMKKAFKKRIVRSRSDTF